MSGYAGKVAVVTGAASGIGLRDRRAGRCRGHGGGPRRRRRGRARRQARAALEAAGTTARAYAADVSDRDAMMALAGRVGGRARRRLAPRQQRRRLPRGDVPRAAAVRVGLHHRRQPLGRRVRPPGVPAGNDRARQRPRCQHILGGRDRHGAECRRATTPPSTRSPALSETLYRELEVAGVGGRRVGALPRRRRDQHRASARTGRRDSGRRPPVRDEPYPELDSVIAAAAVADITFAGIAERRFWILTHPEQYAAGDHGARRGHRRRHQSRRPIRRPELPARAAGCPGGRFSACAETSERSTTSSRR